jgi:hypothetical protein
VVVLSGAAGQKAFLLSMGFLLVFAGWMCRKWLQGPETQREKDSQQAEKVRDAMRESGRIRTVSQQPEWYRRLVRRWNAAGRLGERQRAK